MVKQSLALFILLLPLAANAWGQNLDRLGNHNPPLTRSLLRLAAADDDEDSDPDSELLEAFRSVLEDTYIYDEEIPGGLSHEDSVSRLRDQDRKRVSLDAFDSSVPPSTYAGEFFDGQLSRSCGEDCETEQCEIPEDFKVLPTPNVDVMAFLGIKRAEPLRVERKSWE